MQITGAAWKNEAKEIFKQGVCISMEILEVVLPQNQKAEIVKVPAFRVQTAANAELSQSASLQLWPWRKVKGLETWGSDGATVTPRLGMDVSDQENEVLSGIEMCWYHHVAQSEMLFILSVAAVGTANLAG